MEKSNTLEQQEFFRMLGEGNFERIRAIVSSDSSILDSYDYRNFGATPLTMACFGNRRELVELLLELGADPNRCSDWSMGPWSPLHCALYRHDRELAEYLLSHGAIMDVHAAAGLGMVDELTRLLDEEPARVLERGGDGCQPLHFADTVAVAERLLERGADIDGRCVDHYSTPAQYLCTVRPEVARYLFARGASPDVFSVILCGDSVLLEQLLKNDASLIDARINQKVFPSGGGHNVHNILTFTVGQDSTLLHAAAKGNRAEAIAILIRSGINPNVRGGYDFGTPLHVAAWNNSPEAAKALVENGADINLKSGRLHNNSPAGWAIVAGADQVFSYLMDQGAEIFPWFVDDAQDAIAGRFNAVSSASLEQRQRVLERLQGSNSSK